MDIEKEMLQPILIFNLKLSVQLALLHLLEVA